MARPSKLTPDQWKTIELRLSAGEGASALAKEYGVNPSQITRRVTQNLQNVREIAESIANVQTKLATLPVAQQYAAMSMAEKIRSIGNSLASAAELGAKTALRLHSLANSEVNKVDDVDPLGNVEVLKGVSALTKLANDSSALALGLMSGNKAQPMDDVQDAPTLIEIVAR